MNWNRSYFWNIKKDIHHATIQEYFMKLLNTNKRNR